MGEKVIMVRKDLTPKDTRAQASPKWETTELHYLKGTRAVLFECLVVY